MIFSTLQLPHTRLNYENYEIKLRKSSLEFIAIDEKVNFNHYIGLLPIFAFKVTVTFALNNITQF